VAYIAVIPAIHQKASSPLGQANFDLKRLSYALLIEFATITATHAPQCMPNGLKSSTK
jgi:hypothetical protein